MFLWSGAALMGVQAAYDVSAGLPLQSTYMNQSQMMTDLPLQVTQSMEGPLAPFGNQGNPPLGRLQPTSSTAAGSLTSSSTGCSMVTACIKLTTYCVCDSASSYFFMTLTSPCSSTTFNSSYGLPTASAALSLPIPLVTLPTANSNGSDNNNSTQYLIFQKGFTRDRDGAASFCANLRLASSGTLFWAPATTILPAPSMGITPEDNQDLATSEGYTSSGSGYSRDQQNTCSGNSADTALQASDQGHLDTINSSAMNGTLADVSSSALFLRLSRAISMPVYIRSWQGDTYNNENNANQSGSALTNRTCIALYPGGAIAVPRESCQGPLGFICQFYSSNNTALSQN
jgi:hypothetical protein